MIYLAWLCFILSPFQLTRYFFFSYNILIEVLCYKLCCVSAALLAKCLLKSR